MRFALALVVVAGCRSSSEPAPSPVQDLPLASRAAAPADPPVPTRLVYFSAAGAMTSAVPAPPWNVQPPLADGGLVRPHQLALAFARDPDFARPPELQRGELEGAYALPVLAINTAPLALASPLAPALAIVQLAAHDGALLGVSLGDRAGVFPLGFGPPLQTGAYRPTAASWLELASDADAMTLVDARSGETRTVSLHAGVVDTAALRLAIDELPKRTNLDLFVGADLTTQQLVDALDVVAAGHHVQLVEATKSGAERRAQLAEARAPNVAIGQPSANGDLAKAEIRQVVKTATAGLVDCYTTSRATQPTLVGTVIVNFYIKPDGTVTNATGTGVSPALATCVTAVIQRLTFPHPKGGGGVQVSYPFTFKTGY